MAKITAGSAVKYVLLPGLLPRIKELFFNGFSLLAYYIALIYGIARLIPDGHPYLNQDNIGRFGVRQAIFAAWKNLEFKWKNIDRILFFFAVISGLMMFFAYLAALGFFLVTAPALAGGLSGPINGGWFTNAYPENDIAFMLMDRMLGIPGIFDSKVVTTAEFGAMPSPFHSALHGLFAYFSWGMFMIAMVMFLYFIVDIVLETTITGTPFGKHFENPWVPLRLAVGLGLLIPITYGMNSAQWITLYIAKAGSNFATNGWIAFLEGMDNPLGVENNELVALPATPEFTGLAKDLFTIRACVDVSDRIELVVEERARAAKEAANPSPPPADPDTIIVYGNGKPILPYFVNSTRAENILGTKPPAGPGWPDGYNANYVNLYAEGLRFYNGGDVKIVWGRYNKANLSKYPGGVEPVCGEIVIPNLLAEGQAVPADKDVQPKDISAGLLMGASHMFNALRLVSDISKTGYGDEGGETSQEYYDHWLMKYATDRFYYQETSTGQETLREHAEKEAGNPDCPNDSDNDGIDDEGSDDEGNPTSTFPTLGPCNGPVASAFYLNLIERYQRAFTYGPTMAYDYYTGLGQESLNNKCTKVQNCTGGTDTTCFNLKKNCAFLTAQYKDYKPYPDVYYKTFGQDNPFLIQKAVDQGLLKYGWGGAGIWYKLIAQVNGELTGSTNSLPRLTHYPLTMERTGQEKAANDKAVTAAGCDKFNPAIVGYSPINIANDPLDGKAMSRMYYNLCKNLYENEFIKLPGAQTALKSGNRVLDMVNALFGSSSLFSFQENSTVNPLAQMAGLGRALVDKAIHNIMMAAGGSAVGGIMTVLGSMGGEGAGSAGAMMEGFGIMVITVSKLAVTIAMVGLTCGVVLFYVLPFMPFMYFFFAVGAWAKSVFEALVGMPLWALAHIRLSGGPGFSGKAASGGYFLLLEIFIRPIITVIALVSSVIIFTAMASMLNMTWGMVTKNLVGFDPVTQLSTNPLDVSTYRPRIDQFFFTIVYVMFMYMTATGCFKLIDLIPDNIMRWINEVKTIGSMDSSEELVGDVKQIVGYPMMNLVTPIATKGVDLMHEIPQGTLGVISDMKEITQRLSPPPRPAPKPPTEGGAK